MLTDANTFRRLAAGACLVLAPLCLLLGMVTDPTDPGPYDPLAYARNPAAVGVSATLLHYAWVLFVPGVIGLVHLVRRKGVVLANLAGALTVLGLINFSSLMISDFFDIVLFQRLPAEQAHKIMEEAAQPAMIAAWQLPGMIGSFLGLVLVAVAYARSGRAGWWFPVGVLGGIAVWIYGASSWNELLGFGGPVVLLLVFGFVGVSIIRMPDAEWSGAPAVGAPGLTGPGAGAGSR
ncbi:hypothetical protein HD597_011497 [Nonomuraea thailandensis]|uniref:DUF4386 family protein n=1 Tax=Nonomuraea thailandensis TaxID=1188745 RepID=A0A9X2K890_9ACTN|nr:hypothetical protein [Nonomuraea thailandensis]MCP2364477.1 hypothetical protein [Nonomuraea thailandensis]